MLLGFILTIHKQLEDANNKDKDSKTKIYHMDLKTMLQRIYPSFSSVDFEKRDIYDVVALLKYQNDIKLVYVDSYKKFCYFILVDFMVNYKGQILIINIKANMKYKLEYQVILPKLMFININQDCYLYFEE